MRAPAASPLPRRSKPTFVSSIASILRLGGGRGDAQNGKSEGELSELSKRDRGAVRRGGESFSLPWSPGGVHARKESYIVVAVVLEDRCDWLQGSGECA